MPLATAICSAKSFLACTMASSIWLSALTSTMTYFGAVRLFALEEEVRVVAAHGVGVRVDVLDEEVGLAVGQHAGEVDLLDALLAQQIPEQLVLGVGVEAVGVEVEALGAFLVLMCRRSYGRSCPWPPSPRSSRSAGSLMSSTSCSSVCCRLIEVVELAEQARDDLVVEQLVELVASPPVRRCPPWSSRGGPRSPAGCGSGSGRSRPRASCGEKSSFSRRA